MRPIVFGHQYSSSLDLALGCYANMCSAYFGRRDAFFGTIDRYFADFNFGEKNQIKI